jgi:hypothetical protein
MTNGEKCEHGVDVTDGGICTVCALLRLPFFVKHEFTDPDRLEDERVRTRLAAAHEREKKLAADLDSERRVAKSWQETTTKAIESAKKNFKSKQQAMALLDDAFRFIAGLNLQDHPLALQKEQRAMLSKLSAVLRSPSTAADNRMAYYETVLDRLKMFAGPSKKDES